MSDRLRSASSWRFERLERSTPAASIRTTELEPPAAGNNRSDTWQRKTGYLKLRCLRSGEPVASDWPLAPVSAVSTSWNSAGVQRANAEGREEHPDPGDHHHLRPFLHLRDEDAADVPLPGRLPRSSPAGSAGPRQGRQGVTRQVRDRREEDEGSHCDTINRMKMVEARLFDI